MLAVQLHATAAFGSATESGMLIDHPLLRRGVLGSGYSTMLLVVLIDIWLLMLTWYCNNAIGAFLFLSCGFNLMAVLSMGDRRYGFTAQCRMAIMTLWMLVQQVWGIHTQNDLGYIHMKSCRDVRPQGSVTSLIGTEVARLWWQARSFNELSIVGTVSGNRGARLFRTRRCSSCARCTRVLDAV